MNGPPTTIRGVLRIPAYRAIWSAQTISDLGDATTFLTLLLLINERTHSTGLIALMSIVLAAPQFTVGLLAGVVADRVNRRLIMRAADLVRFGLVGTLALVAADALPAAFVLAGLAAAAGSFFNPARGAMLPNVVPESALPAANSLAQASRVVASLVGTGLAGILFASVGPAPAFAIDAATFLVSFGLISLVPSQRGAIMDAREEQRQTFGRSFRDGLAIIAKSRLLIATIVSMTTLMLALGAVNVLLVPFIVDGLGMPPWWLGAAELAQTTSLIASAAFVAILVGRLGPARLIPIGLAGMTTFLFLLGFAQEGWHVLALLFFVGWVVTPIQASVTTIVQTATDDAARGRAVSVLSAALSTTNVASMAFAGILGETLGARGVFFVASGTVALALLVALLMFGPELRSRSRAPVAA